MSDLFENIDLDKFSSYKRFLEKYTPDKEGSTSMTTQTVVPGPIVTEQIFFDLIEELDFDPRKLPERTHETFMLQQYHDDWNDIMETLAWAWACNNEEVAAQCMDRFAQLHAKFNKPPARKRTVKKAAPHKPTNASDKKGN